MSDQTGRSTRKRRAAAGGRGLKRQSSVEGVTVEIPFSLSVPEGSQTTNAESNKRDNHGAGCYVSATIGHRRYYGVLVDQEALKSASLLHFQDEASSLDLNRRMEMLKQRPNSNLQEEKRPATSNSLNGHDGSNGDKRHLEQNHDESDSKRAKVDDKPLPLPDARPVQKCRYVEETKSSNSYRILVATFVDVNAASDDKEDVAKLIRRACEDGGDYVGDYYYQYEILPASLIASKNEKRTDVGFRASMGMDSFLRNTSLPIWFPLSNIADGQESRVLSMLHMKKGRGSVTVSNDAATGKDATLSDALPPMEPRKCFRVGVLGGGMSGLACATELFRRCDKRIDLEVVILEGRKRIGGRLFTDEFTFTLNDGKTPFPVDLGASWIHGIDHNPLATLAKEAGVDFISSSEDVRMFGCNTEEVDNAVDEEMGKLFDDLLDQASEDAWKMPEFVPEKLRHQKAVRWYASVLKPKTKATCSQEGTGSSQLTERPQATDATLHRHSSDVSVDHAVGNVISSSKIREFSRMSKTQHSLLLWNTKNIEYANGANMADLSMRYMDSDDRHAFEGEHVLLKQGYSSVARHLYKKLKQKGDKFKIVFDFQIAKIEYARKTASLPYIDFLGKNQKCVELTDSCMVTSRNDDKKFKFDFLVCTLPLGVLKNSVGDDQPLNKVVFDPPLPPTKIDAINSVGFGLLNKVYLHFPYAFWRVKEILDDDQTLFGNATGYNPHHYMFLDVGKSLRGPDGPAVLMTLISGVEAVDSERMSHDELVADVMKTLRRIFSNRDIPDPVTAKTTRWGSDEYARGCYSFLPPGASDEDFSIIQSPINGNGDSLLLENNETMRLFWAGEHTTSLHPSTAHGAMLSGLRAAAEIIDTMNVNNGKLGIDRLIPLVVFRNMNPTSLLKCGLCHLVGSRTREGSLLAFQRGSRQVLAHNNCAEYSPEVEVRDGKWKNVIKALNRGKQINCTLCGSTGATIGCTEESCNRSYHFRCCEDTGWRFQRDGKVFYCDLHRMGHGGKPKSLADCDMISIPFFRTKYPNVVLKCGLCGGYGDDSTCGKLIAFQGKSIDALVHEKCARFTTIVETTKEDSVENQHDEFQNIFQALKSSRVCSLCRSHGATIRCTGNNCVHHFHFKCADSEWDFNKKKGAGFRCVYHRVAPVSKKEDMRTVVSSNPEIMGTSASANEPLAHSLFTHSLFNGTRDKSLNIGASNAGMGSLKSPGNDRSSKIGEYGNLDDSGDESILSDGVAYEENWLSCPLSCYLPAAEASASRTVHRSTVSRPSCTELWGLSFAVGSSTCSASKDAKKKYYLYVESCSNKNFIKKGDMIISLNSIKIGSYYFRNLQQILSYMESSIKLVVEFLREKPPEVSCGPSLSPVSSNCSRVVRLQRPLITIPWSVSFGLGSCPTNNTTKLLLVHSFHGGEINKDIDLQQGDIVISINGIKVGSSSLQNFDKIKEFMDRSMSISIEYVRYSKGYSKAAI